jgi:hypothetical protein
MTNLGCPPRQLVEKPAADESFLFAPAVVLASFAVATVNLVSLRMPLEPWLPYLALGLAILVVLGMRRVSACRIWCACAFALGWIVLSIVSERTFPWPTVSSNPDAWSYGAVASYLTHHSRGTDSGMSLIDQYASHLSNSRFASPCLLSLAEYLVGEEHLFAAHSAFCVVCLATMFFSGGYLGSSLGLSRTSSLFLGGGLTLCGWTQDCIIVGNYDNLVFVAMLPSAVGLLLHFLAGSVRLVPFVAWGSLLAAGLICTYPEGLVMEAIIAVPLFVYALFVGLKEPRKFTGLVMVILFGIGLSASYLRIFVGLIRSLMADVSGSGIRPGEGYFMGLLGKGFAPAIFGLGNEFPASSAALVCNALPLLALLLMVIGIRRLALEKPWFPWIALTFAALLLHQMVVRHYSYGAYKVIICCNWWVFAAIIAGTEHLIRQPKRGKPVAVGIIILIGAAVCQRFNQWSHRIWRPYVNLDAVSALSDIRYVTQGKPILLDLDSDFELLWATAILRDEPLVILQLRSYLNMAHVQKYLARARPVDAGLQAFVLRSGHWPDAIWENARFSLLRRSDATVVGVDNPNGNEEVDGLPFVWIAHSRATIFRIDAVRSGQYDLVARNCLFGPSAVNLLNRVIEIRDAAGLHTVTITAASNWIPITLASGLNQVLVRSITPVTMSNLANGDTRELLIGLGGYFVRDKVTTGAESSGRR